MGADEEGTLTRLRAHRRSLVDRKLSEYRGRIVKTTGDGMLVEFASALDAVCCAVDIQRGMAEGRELGVRYVLEGSIRKSKNQVRITGQLIDASTGGQLWAGRSEGNLEDVFGLQDQITESVVGQIAPELERAEINRAKRKPTERLDAYDYFLRGMANFHQQTNESNEALRLFYRAIELDPDFASPHGLGGLCYSRRKTRGWTTDHAQELAEAERLARRAVELGRDDAVALYTAGFTLAHVVGDINAGADLIDSAL